jgi:outer membrane protein OmpA-like peptidoglycan-associated protein
MRTDLAYTAALSFGLLAPLAGQNLTPPKGTQATSWAATAERTVDGPEADLLIRVGDIDNLGFGWPRDFNPFSGQSTPPHSFPWKHSPGDPSGTDRIMLASSVSPNDVSTRAGDGYSRTTARTENQPEPIIIELGALPRRVDAVLVQLFVDDFQAPVWGSYFQVTLNGVRIPAFESALNALRQTGPIGKLVTLKLLPEYWPLLRGGRLQLLIEDLTTHVPDGYAVDFVRVLINPRPSTYSGTVTSSVVDADTRMPIAGATVTAALGTTVTGPDGRCVLSQVTSGLVVVSAVAEGYDLQSSSVDLVAGATANVELLLRRHHESAEYIDRALTRAGSAAIYGLRFDFDSSTLRSDSEPALQSLLTSLKKRSGTRWVVIGHTDSRGAAPYNARLSKARADAVVGWLRDHGVPANALVARGSGAEQPIADNATDAGRALNRRVEVPLLP